MSCVAKRFDGLHEELEKVQAGIDRTKISWFKHYKNLIIGIVAHVSYFCFHIIFLPCFILKAVVWLGVPFSKSIFSLYALVVISLGFWNFFRLATYSDFSYKQFLLTIYLEKKYPSRYPRR